MNRYLFNEYCMDPNTRIGTIMRMIQIGWSDQDISDWSKVQTQWPDGEMSKRDVRVYRKAYEGKLSEGSLYYEPPDRVPKQQYFTVMDWMYGHDNIQPLEHMRIVNVQELHDMILEKTGAKTISEASAMMGIGKYYLLKAERSGEITARAAAMIGDIIEVNLYREGWIERID